MLRCLGKQGPGGVHRAAFEAQSYRLLAHAFSLAERCPKGVEPGGVRANGTERYYYPVDGRMVRTESEPHCSPLGVSCCTSFKRHDYYSEEIAFISFTVVGETIKGFVSCTKWRQLSMGVNQMYIGSRVFCRQ